MHIVYILISKKYPNRCYVGYTTDLVQRIKDHNNGGSVYTKKYGPWLLATYVVFEKKLKAMEFERYLKSGSGFAFLKRRLI